MLENSNFQSNTLEKGFMFEFKHNFKSTTIKNTAIAYNTGYLLEMIPSDSLNTQKTQNL